MRIIIVPISILLFAFSLNAQTECQLNLPQSPTILNLKLGMTPAEASAVLPIKVKAKPEGQRTVFQNYLKKNGKGSLVGVRALFLRFYNGKLYQIEIFYKKEYRWPDLESFLSDYSAQTNFPNQFWQTEYGYSKAKCEGFSLDADYILNPHIQITDDRIAEVVDKEREKKGKLF